MNQPKHPDVSMSDLRAQLDAMDSADDRVGPLKSLADDIEKRLGRSADADLHPKLGERVTASIVQFESSHPRIATLLNELAEKLSDMGI